MVNRILYAIAAVLALIILWLGWDMHNAYRYLERETPEQSYGADPKNARVTVLAFMDYTSRPSKMMSPAIMQAVMGNPDSRVVFHVLPQTSPLALRAAKIALAAAKQNKFMPMHEELMRNEKPLTDDNIKMMAERVKLDLNQLFLDADSEEIAKQLVTEIKMASILNIDQVPLFIFNRKMLYGPENFDVSDREFNLLIKRAGS